jgi:hypothetical protein
VLSGTYNVVWLSPTSDIGDSFSGSMPLGNGDTQCTAWANISAGGMSFYVAKQDAVHSDTSPFKVALVTIEVTPSPFQSGPYFNQTFDVAAARVVVEAGGNSHSSFALALSVWVDANSNTVYATASAGAGHSQQKFSISVVMTPVRPAGYDRFVPDWHCSAGSSAADLLVDPVSSCWARTGYISSLNRDALRDAQIPSQFFSSPNSTLVMFHANDPAAGKKRGVVLIFN